MSILVLNEREVREVLTVPLAVESQREAFRALGGGQAVLPPRLLVPGTGPDVSFCYAARIRPDGPAVSKFGSVNPGNSSRGLPAIHAVIVVLDETTGRPAAFMDGTSITEIRTAAASAVAAEALAGTAQTLAVIGVGTQGVAHVRALHHTHALRQVRLWGPRAEHTAQVAADLGAETGVDVSGAPSAEEAVRDADLVITCTTSATPVLERSWLAPGATLISVGSFAPDRHEYDQDVLERADVIVVDDLETARTDAGPVARALAEGLLSDDQVCTLGQVLVGDAPGRTTADQLVVYTTVGLGAQDAAAAAALLPAAREAGLGHLMPWGD
ncbi:ornithine cyclodeaminase family protein [Ornithinimicrobium cavernae]|uniref:ornithine cyclodeaminase family protein n=1 Tax=Ornithinimicrobium cavernae TaxID=2666047 RepID=UPI000D6995F6|nr:ornithine cyclodeaminase family protein [Ornithinimicrobium cavernae]